MASLLISDATVLTVDSSDTVFAGGWVAFADGRIGGAGPRETMPDPAGFDEALALPGHLVMPGLVNAHTHSAMILFRGRSEGQSLLTMQGWYDSIREPELSLAASDIGPAVALSCAEMLLSGTTTFCDQYFFAEEIAAAAADSGIRAVVAYGIVELGDAARGDRRTCQGGGLRRTAALERWADRPLVRSARPLCRQFRSSCCAPRRRWR